ncbi:hypothetical protein [Olivibacter sitiensis]|uniref:hypothetical protein n=1 Tax=Olivibacter sitiensis TaxID=376470 RepID=UPI0003FDAA85|nr:hypothetical protein [Olivibacter sitiensis]
MKAFNTFKSCLFALFIVASLTHCTKEGAVGPRGEAGEAGADGSIIYSGTDVPENSLGSIGDYYYRTTTSDFYGPKAETGWGTPTSLKGATGATGVAGPTGATGAAGSQIYSGTTAPGTALGRVGDFYFNRNNGDFYGPKTDAGWGTAVSLRGATGPAGADGSTIISGAGEPTAAIGKIGDYYFRSLTGDFYGPKTASGWGAPTSLKGATGETGATGATGAAGSQILSGTSAPAAALGRVGDFYFDRSNADFYGPKTASGWGTPTSLKGSTGPAGADGSTIISGAAVPTAAIGNIGDYYFRSLTGDFYGPKTASGWGTPTSLRGATGATGATGAAGSQILSGTSAPATALGRVGDFYFDRSNADFYGPKTSSGWGTPVNLRGPQGPPGTANVIYSDWITVGASGDTPVYNHTISAPALTQEILDRGQISVYMRADNHGTWEVFQLREGWFSTSEYGIGYRARVAAIALTTSGGVRLNDYQYRYVLIPGGIPGGGDASANLKLDDYETLKVQLKLRD